MVCECIEVPVLPIFDYVAGLLTYSFEPVYRSIIEQVGAFDIQL